MTETPRKTSEANSKTGRRGCLKIFFGYSAGAGKTYAMLKAARAAKNRGTDVVVGFAETHSQPKTDALLTGFEVLPLLHGEFDLDGALKRAPGLLILDMLAHTNAKGCRHARRYQDVEELLKAGIDVYTTANVQDIESLNDMVASITGSSVGERIPDSIFDNADQVELVDVEPQELIERLNGGFKKGPLTQEKLAALRELALRRCADRVNLLTEHTKASAANAYRTDEHILVCLSSAPSNAKLIRTAARMASAFRGTFTALFVETPDFSVMSSDDKARLRANMRLAQQLGAKIETVCGEDISLQIAEFARLSGVSKIVIGRSTATRRGFFKKPALTDRLIANAPSLDIHIIPDSMSAMPYRAKTAAAANAMAVSLRDIGKSIGILLLATLIGYAFSVLGFTEANIITVYILGVLIISVITNNWIYSLLSSLVSVLVFNFFFTVPKFTFLAYDKGYPVTFLVMFLASFFTGSLATRLKNHAKQAAQAAYRTKVLFDTNQLLQQAAGKDAIIAATARQLIKLLGRDVVFYPSEDGNLQEPQYFSASDAAPESLSPASGRGAAPESLSSSSERDVALWVLKNNKHAGATTDTFSDARCLYLAVRVNDSVYGVVGIAVGDTPLAAFENSVLLSILGESALALENEKNAKEKEEAAILAKNEKLRANLLRAISHDLRTPLTSISGNASNLLCNGDSFNESTKKQIYTDIYDDSMWLINLVENLLSVTRIEEGRMNIHLSAELMDEVIAEALRHCNRKGLEHKFSVAAGEEFLLARMDARLIVQVLINIVDNAIKYTPAGSEIAIRTRKEGGFVVVDIADNGPGIPDDAKPRIFDMFYTGKTGAADSRRSLGLGLSLCKSIVNAHGGTISVSDNVPHGTIFTFTLPAEEVTLHE